MRRKEARKPKKTGGGKSTKPHRNLRMRGLIAKNRMVRYKEMGSKRRLKSRK